MTKKLTDNAKSTINQLVNQYKNQKPDGGAIVVFETINGIEYIHHNPNEFTFVQPEYVEIINGKEYVKSSYLLPILERKFLHLFLIPSNKRD